MSSRSTLGSIVRHSDVVDYVAHFRREVEDFETAARTVGDGDAPIVPSCPDWTMTDLVAHLGGVHRGIIHIVRGGLRDEPDWTDLGMLELPAGGEDWPMSLENTPTHGPLPDGMVDWFADGASTLAELFAGHDPAEPAWTWSPDQSVGFWRRMQCIEAAVHRWDSENAIGIPSPIDTELASDAVRQTFEVMAPYRRALLQAAPGQGEQYGFRPTDSAGAWTVRFDGDTVRLDDAAKTGSNEVEFVGAASDLALFLWGRLSADRLADVRGNPEAIDRYFTLVPRL